MNLRHVLSAWISAIVRVVAFAGDDFISTIPVEVRQCDRVRLRKRLVDHFLIELDRAILFDAGLTPPIQTVIMAGADDDVILSILVEIDRHHGDAALDIPVGTELPFGLPRFLRLLVPAMPEQDIIASIAIDVANTHAVLIA